MSRIVNELVSAHYAKNPFKRAPCLRGKKAAGKRYEKLLGEELEFRNLTFCHGPWIAFADQNGKGFAQPDFIVYETDTRWLVLEAKLSQTDAAFVQLFSLYLPLLSFLHPNVELIPIQVCKNLRKSSPKIIEDLGDACHGAIWHWLA